jgi:hypothetical protein
MKDLIEALNIFLKYRDEKWPTCCVHDNLLITGVTFEEVSDEDKAKLEEMNFSWSEEYGCWASYRFGSA